MFGLIFRQRPAAAVDEQVLARLRKRVPHLLTQVDRRTRISDLPADSLDLVELLCAIEDEFGVGLTAEAFQQARTVGDLAGAIARLAERKRRAP